MLKFFFEAWRKSFDYRGRASRSQYWWFSLWSLLSIWLVAWLSIELAWRLGVSSLGSLWLLYLLASMFPGLAILVRRLRDAGKGPGWVLIGFVPFIGGIWLFCLTLMPSVGD